MDQQTVNVLIIMIIKRYQARWSRSWSGVIHWWQWPGHLDLVIEIISSRIIFLSRQFDINSQLIVTCNQVTSLHRSNGRIERDGGIGESEDNLFAFDGCSCFFPPREINAYIIFFLENEAKSLVDYAYVVVSWFIDLILWRVVWEDANACFFAMSYHSNCRFQWVV